MTDEQKTEYLESLHAMYDKTVRVHGAESLQARSMLAIWLYTCDMYCDDMEENDDN